MPASEGVRDALISCLRYRSCCRVCTHHQVPIGEAHDRKSGNADCLFSALEMCGRAVAVGGDDLGFDEGADTGYEIDAYNRGLFVWRSESSACLLNSYKFDHADRSEQGMCDIRLAGVDELNVGLLLRDNVVTRMGGCAGWWLIGDLGRPIALPYPQHSTVSM